MVAVIKLNALFGEPVEMGCANLLISVAAQVVLSKRIRNYEYNIHNQNCVPYSD